MANRDHVSMLRSGALAWNSWRANNLNVLPDLSGLKLPGREMQWSATFGPPIDLRGACLAQANLEYANLEGAMLVGADLRQTRIVGTRLCGADMQGADLRHSFMRGVNFQDVNLDGVFLSGADLRYVFNLEVTQLMRTQFDQTTIVPFDVEFGESGFKITDRGHHLVQPRGHSVDIMPGVRSPVVE